MKWVGPKLEPIVVTSDLKKDLILKRLNLFGMSLQNKRTLSLLIISYETGANYIEELRKHHYGLLVCDEAHRLKNPKTKVPPAPLAPPFGVSSSRVSPSARWARTGCCCAAFAPRGVSLSRAAPRLCC